MSKLNPAESVYGMRLIITNSTIFEDSLESQFELNLKRIVQRLIRTAAEKKDVADVWKEHGICIEIRITPDSLRGTPCPAVQSLECEPGSTSSEKRPEKNRS